MTYFYTSHTSSLVYYRTTSAQWSGLLPQLAVCIIFSFHSCLLLFHHYLLYSKLNQQWWVSTCRHCWLGVYNTEVWNVGHRWTCNKTGNTTQHGCECLWWLLGTIGLMCRVYNVAPVRVFAVNQTVMSYCQVKLLVFWL